MSAGIYLRSLSGDGVPLYYEHLARVKSGKTLAEWQEMSRWDKAMVVAIMQIESAVKGHQADAEIEQAEKKNNKVD